MSKRFVTGLLFLTFCLAACGKKEEKTALPDEKISRIMADLFIADAATTGLAGYPKDSLMQVYFDQVLTMHRVSREAYEKDLRIIARDLERMETVVKNASELLDKERKKETKSQ